MVSIGTSSPLEDVEFLARSEHRVVALVALTEAPRTRAELRELTRASSSTVGRLLRQFERRHWVARNGHRYEATPLGAFVASGMEDLIDRIETERKLRDIWHWLPSEASTFAIQVGADAVVTVAEADDPYRPVNRFASLLRETDRFRFVGPDLALLEPCKDDLRRWIVDGLRAEIVDPPHVARYILSTYAEHCAEPLESGNLAVWTHDELPPYGVSIFDDRIGISCYNPDSGTVQVLIDTGAPEAREWAETTYLAYRREADPLTHELTA